MKNISSLIKNTLFGIGIASTTIFGGYVINKNYTEEKMEKTILEFTKENFRDEKVHIGTRVTGQKMFMDFRTPIVYDLDNNNKMILDEKMITEKTIFDRIKEEGYDLKIDIDYDLLDPIPQLGKNSFILTEEYLKLNEKGELNVLNILEKIKRMDREECIKNTKIKKNGRDYLNRLYVIKTDEENLFFLKFKKINRNERKITLESYRLNKKYLPKEDHQ